jgi:competence protein ComEC
MGRIPLFWLSLALILGIFFSQSVFLPVAAWEYALAAAGFLFVTESRLGTKWRVTNALRKKLPLDVFLLLTFFCVGGLRYSLAVLPAQEADLAFYVQSGKVEVIGLICDDPQRKEKGAQLLLCAETVRTQDGHSLSVKGKALLRSPSKEWRYGQRVRAFGTLQLAAQDENFSYRFYLSTRGVSSVMEYPSLQVLQEGQGNWLKGKIYDLRERAYQLINRLLPQPQAGLLAGILLGIESDIPNALEQAFQDTGTAHVIAISGYNMTLLAGLVLSAFRRRLPSAWAGVFALLTIGFYTLLVGGSPAVIRAALMSGLTMSAQLIGRKQAGPFTLTLTVAVLCLFNPLYLWDAGFQLSVMATLGLVLYAGRMSAWLERLAGRWMAEPLMRKFSGFIAEYFLFTLAAQVTTLPVIIFQFEQISLTSLLANPLILPVQPLIMMFGGLAVISGLFIYPIGQAFALLAWLFLTYTLRMVDLLAGIPTGVITVGKVTPLVILLFYSLLFLVTIPNRFLPKLAGLRRLSYASLCFLGATLLVWNAVLTQTGGRLRVVVFDSPNQGAALIQTPGGKRILINSGQSANALSAELNRYLPVFDRHLDLVVYSQTSPKLNLAFPTILERFPLHQFLWAADDASSGQNIAALLLEQEVSSLVWESGAVIDLGDGVRLTRLGENEAGALLILEYGNLRVFFGALNPQEAADEFSFAGSLAVLSPEAQDPQSWADSELLTYIHPLEMQMTGISTWQKGWVQLWSDGEKLWLESEK